MRLYKGNMATSLPSYLNSTYYALSNALRTPNDVIKLNTNELHRNKLSCDKP